MRLTNLARQVRLIALIGEGDRMIVYVLLFAVLALVGITLASSIGDSRQ